MDNTLSNLEKLIQKQNEILVLFSDQLDSNIADTLIVGLIVAVGSAISAYGFNYLHWHQTEKKKNKLSVVSSLSILIREFEDLSLKYWLSDATDDDPELCIKIKCRHLLINRYVNQYIQLFSGSEHAQIVSLFSNLIYDKVTGDDFESRSRVRSISKATSIAKLCSDVAARLNEDAITL